MDAIIELESGRRLGFDIAEITRSFDAPAEIRGYVCSPLEASDFLRKSQNATIKQVIFNDPATVVIWSDGSKTVVKCQPNDTYSKETGLALCIAKKFLGNKGNFNEVFKQWIPEKDKISVKEMRDKLDRFCGNTIACSECALYNDRCGRGDGFKSVDACGNYKMSDDEIKSMFTKAFREV